MSIKQNSDRDLIHKFLNGILNEDEKKTFALRRGNEQFLDLLAELTVKQKGRMDLKHKLRAIGQQQQHKTPTHKKNIVRFSLTSLAVAASLIIALFIFKAEDSSNLFIDNFEPFPNVYASKGIDDNENSSLKEAMRLYDEEAYDKAVLKFKMLNENDLKGYVRLYYSISLLAINDIETSKQKLKHLSSTHPAYAEGQWYLGLAYLKQDSLNKAKVTLENAKQLFGKNKIEHIEALVKKINSIK